MPGTAVRIADDGEVLVKGGIVFGGYRNNPEATAEVLDGGWFATGDLGALDEDGYLTITGRKKDIIVTSGGKNVSLLPSWRTGCAAARRSASASSWATTVPTSPR